ncbi:SRPBCC family protein [Salipiger sp. 1_MG-2023]|uniref:SRPBCC family protein n=1 Tax=Salipiger sp. 1_MG-2023 TaxID=3062665 RepID=UPI0026E362C2|nr:SRPBCC family protein [Salipiger sp. 1_MG-2023]MDO6584039.1 SRPBCC family protein [Salipiger sp. 1_MG-2023]
MDFSTREDIEAPLDRVFALASNFEQLERQVMRHGVEVTRLTPDDIAPTPEGGKSWLASFRFRGKARSAQVDLTRYDPPNTMVYTTTAGGLRTLTTVEFVALSRTRTRIGISVELQPQTLSARLLVQSLKLARGTIEKRFKVAIANYATEIEKRFKRQA